jgi:hypothetical protein
MTTLAVQAYFAGGGVDVSGWFVAFFVGFMLLLVGLAFYFNLTPNHREWYVDEHWGDGSIDDDDWGLAIADARRSTRRALAELADRDAARSATT